MKNDNIKERSNIDHIYILYVINPNPIKLYCLISKRVNKEVGLATFCCC